MQTSKTGFLPKKKKAEEQKEKPLDKFFKEYEKEELERDAKLNNMKPHLDKQLTHIQSIDNKIGWYEEKAKDLEADKQNALRKMDDLMEMAMVQRHELKNGYTVLPVNKRKVTIESIDKFMIWLKKNKEPQDVFNFLKDAIKLTRLKKFCDVEANQQRMNGILKPEIDGIDFGEVTYRRLTTKIKKEKKK